MLVANNCEKTIDNTNMVPSGFSIVHATPKKERLYRVKISRWIS